MNQQLDVEEIESISTQLFQIVGLQIPQLCEAIKVISMCGKTTKGSEVKEDTMCREAIFGLLTLFQPD